MRAGTATSSVGGLATIAVAGLLVQAAPDRGRNMPATRCCRTARLTLDPRFAQTLQSEPAVWLDWGRDNYVGVTWSDVPARDGRRISIGWMSNWD